MKKRILILNVIIVCLAVFILYSEQPPTPPATILDSRNLSEEEVKPIGNLNSLTKEWKKMIPLNKKAMLFTYLLVGENDKSGMIIPVIENYMQQHPDIEWIVVSHKKDYDIANGKVIVDSLALTERVDKSLTKEMHFTFSPILAYYDLHGQLVKWQPYYSQEHFVSFIENLEEEGNILPTLLSARENIKITRLFKEAKLRDYRTNKYIKVGNLVKKPTVMAFVYTVELTSRAVLKYMNKLSKKYGKKVNFVVLGVEVDGNDVSTYVGKYKKLIFVEVTEDVYNEKLSTVIKFDMAPTIFLLVKGKLLYTIKGFNEFENIIKNEMIK